MEKPLDRVLPSSDFAPVVLPLAPAITPLKALRRLRPLGGSTLLHSPSGAPLRFAARANSAGSGLADRARFSFLVADPIARWSPSWRTLTEARSAGRRPLERLDRVLRRHTTPALAGLPPFQGGWAGLCGYELGGLFERLPLAQYDPLGMPAAVFALHDVVIAWDHSSGSAWIISQGLPETNPDRRLERATIRAAMFAGLLEQDAAPANVVRWPRRIPLGHPGRGFPPLHGVEDQVAGWNADLALQSNFSPDAYRRAVRRCVELIHAGDVFQVNLAQQLYVAGQLNGLDLFESLAELNPAPFSAWFDLGSRQVISASPERLFSVRDRWIETCPIKGTRPRTGDPVSDEAAARELLASRKDRAENTMIVDLMRNDLSRICIDESVQVTRWCQLESFATVHHLVSSVRGQLRADKGFADIFAAVFPGGSVTGAPRIRAMEIITELEQTARGAYCGSAGYIGLDGSADFNILIRTITAGRGWWQAPVGGGIVADSDPDGEYAETWAKAAGLLNAIAAVQPLAVR